MKTPHIDTNFAFAILILVASLVGFVFWLDYENRKTVPEAQIVFIESKNMTEVPTEEALDPYTFYPDRQHAIEGYYQKYSLEIPFDCTVGVDCPIQECDGFVITKGQENFDKYDWRQVDEMPNLINIRLDALPKQDRAILSGVSPLVPMSTIGTSKKEEVLASTADDPVTLRFLKMPWLATDGTSFCYSSIEITDVIDDARGEKAENWQTYWNDEYGFTFKYPSNWEIRAEIREEFGLNIKLSEIGKWYLYEGGRENAIIVSVSEKRNPKLTTNVLDLWKEYYDISTEQQNINGVEGIYWSGYGEGIRIANVPEKDYQFSISSTIMTTPAVAQEVRPILQEIIQTVEF